MQTRERRAAKLPDKINKESDSQNLLSLYDPEFLESIYQRATKCEENSESYRKNAGVLRSIGGYRDSSALADKYEEIAASLEKSELEKKRISEEKEKAIKEEQQKKADKRQITLYSIGIAVLSIFLIFLICYNTFLGGLIKKRAVLDEIYPLTYDDVTVLTKKEAPWFKINEDGELSFKAEEYTGDGKIIIPDVFDNTLVRGIAEGGFSRASAITEVVISDYVESIGEKAFEYCTSLKKVDFPEYVEQISAYAFHGCSALSEVDIPESVIRICDGAFSGCAALTEITLPDSLEYVEQFAFQNCASIESLYFGKGVKVIEIRAFSNCLKLKSVYYGGSAEELAEIDIAIDNGPFDDTENADYTFVYNYTEN